MAGEYPYKHIVDRTLKIAFKPSEFWAETSQENVTASECFLRYLLVIQAIPAAATFLGLVLFGYSAGPLGSVSVPIGRALGAGITAYVQGLAAVGLAGWLASFLAPKFGGASSLDRGITLMTMAFLPAAAAGILMLVPSLSLLSGLVGLYSLYLAWVGIGPMMGIPDDRKVPYAVVLFLAAVLIVSLFTVMSRKAVW
jgi:hypothetical protein